MSAANSKVLDTITKLSLDRENAKKETDS